jgi:hypothetical protein
MQRIYNVTCNYVISTCRGVRISLTQRGGARTSKEDRRKKRSRRMETENRRRMRRRRGRRYG